jgi:hypothetical protein
MDIFDKILQGGYLGEAIFFKDVHRGDYQDIAVLVKDLSQD